MSELDATQLQAVEQAKRQRLCVVYGGPGTGKSTVTQEIVKALPQPVLCVAPTGKAAERLKQAVGDAAEVYTLDKVLATPECIERFRQRAALVDEASMVGMELLADFCRDVQPSRLVLVGDAHQLPPVGDAPVFPVLVRSPGVPSVELTRVYRQNHASALYRAIRGIHAGRADFGDDDSFHLLLTPNQRERVAELCTQTPRPQFLCLTNEMRAELNSLVQSKVNAKGRKVQGITWMDVREGDPVMCTKNLYDKETGTLLVSNGAMGCVMNQRGTGKLVVVYGTTFADAPNKWGKYESTFELAYCITVHKSQGDEFPSVVVALGRGGGDWATRALLYTAVSRAKESCTVLAESMAQIESMLRQQEVHKVDFPPILGSAAVQRG